MNVTARETSPPAGASAPDRPVTGTRGRRRTIAAARHWPARRWVAAAMMFPAVTVLFSLAGRAGLAGPPVWWAWPWTVATGALATVVLASYVPAPGTGRLLDTGCTPCAAAAALSLVIAMAAHASAPASPFMAVAATAAVAMGARRRLSQPETCPAAPGRTGPAGTV